MHNKTKINALALAAALVLTACGGGGGDGDKGNTQPEDTAPPPSSALTKLPSDTFIMTAVDGDTFRLVVNRNSNTAEITPLNTMYGVQDTPNIPVKIFDTDLGITAYQSQYPDGYEGNTHFEIYTSPDGNEIVGEVQIGGLKSNVIGTNLQINRFSGLPIDGSYNGISMESGSATGKRSLYDFGIKSVNGDLTFCENGFYSNNTCTGIERPAQFSANWGGMATLQVNSGNRYRNYAYVMLAQNGSKYSLILDRLENEQGRLVFGTGYAVPADEYKLTSATKTFACIKQDASGGSYLSLRDDRTYMQDKYDGKLNYLGSVAGTLDLNRAVARSNVVSTLGIVSFVEGSTTGLPANPATKFTRGLAFNKNMMVLADEDSQTLSVCRSDSLVAKK